MDILVADKFPEPYLRELQSKGHNVVFEPDLVAEELPGAIDGHQALVVRSTRVTAATLEAASRLELVVRAGAGTNTIDTQGAADKGIFVCNVPGRNAVAVAELTLGLLLALDRRIPDNVFDLRNGRWDKKRYSQARGLYGRCIGIVGLGAIGMAVAERAAAFGMNIHVVGKTARPVAVESRLRALGAVSVESLDRLAETCDVLTFHVPAADGTKRMVNARLLERLQPHSIIINTSRGDIVDEDALIAAMDAKGIRAGLDVYADEPGGGEAEFDSVLARHPNVYGTHHIGASTAQAQEAVAQGVVEILEAYARGEVLNCVNREA